MFRGYLVRIINSDVRYHAILRVYFSLHQMVITKEEEGGYELIWLTPGHYRFYFTFRTVKFVTTDKMSAQLTLGEILAIEKVVTQSKFSGSWGHLNFLNFVRDAWLRIEWLLHLPYSKPKHATKTHPFTIPQNHQVPRIGKSNVLLRWPIGYHNDSAVWVWRSLLQTFNGKQSLSNRELPWDKSWRFLNTHILFTHDVCQSLNTQRRFDMKITQCCYDAN